MLADCIRLAQTNNEALEALLQKFAPLIKKCGRQLHIEDGNEEMILAFIELVKDFSPSNLRNIDDGTVVQYIKQSMYHYCFRIYKKYHHVELAGMRSAPKKRQSIWRPKIRYNLMMGY